MNTSGTTGTSLPGIQGAKGETSRQTFYGSKNVTDSSIGRLKISGTEKFAQVPENTSPHKGDFVLYTENELNSYTLYNITSSNPDASIGNFTCECIMIDQFLNDQFLKDDENESIDVNIGVVPVIKTATIRKFGALNSENEIPRGGVLLYPIETKEEDIHLNMEIFNIFFYSDNDLSDDIKFVLEFTDDYSSPRTYSSLIYRFGAYGQTQGHPNEVKAMGNPILTYRGVFDAYRNQTVSSSYDTPLQQRIVGYETNRVMNYTDPKSGYIPDNYCIERLDNFSITVKNFNETIEKGKLFNKDVLMPAELLSNRRVCGLNTKNLSNYKIILTAYVKKTPVIYEKIFVSDFTDILKDMMDINRIKDSD